YVEIAPWRMSAKKSRFTFSIWAPLAASHAARDAGHVLLPTRSERQREHVAQERARLLHRDQLTTALVGDVSEALLHVLVEIRKRRDFLHVLVVLPLGELALELLVERLAHVDRADDAAARVPVVDELLERRDLLRMRRRAADQDDDLLRVGAPFQLAHRGLEA